MVSASEKELRLAVKTFVMRSPKRDVEKDRKRIVPIMEAIASAIHEISAERTGLIAQIQKTMNQPEARSKKILAHDGTPTTNPLAELQLAEKRSKLLARQIEKLKAAQVLLEQG